MKERYADSTHLLARTLLLGVLIIPQWVCNVNAFSFHVHSPHTSSIFLHEQTSSIHQRQRAGSTSIHQSNKSSASTQNNLDVDTSGSKITDDNSGDNKGSESNVDGDGKEQQNDKDLTYFEILAGNVVNCLLKSDLKRKGGGDGGSTGWTSWVDDASSYQLKGCIDMLSLNIPVSAMMNCN